MRLSLIGTVLTTLVIANTAAAATAGAVPDSVLAEIGTRRVTASEFVRQWDRIAPTYPAEVAREERKRLFLDELVNKEVLSLAANEGGFVPSREESALLGLTRLVSMRAAYYRQVVLAPAFAAAGAGGAHDAGVAERQLANERALIDRLVDPLQPVFDDSTLAFLARAFGRLPKPREQGQGWIRVQLTRWMPPVRFADTSRVVVRSRAGAFTVGRFLWHWAQVPAEQRDRPDRPEAVREWTRSFLSQNPIDEEARRLGFGTAHEVEEEAARRRELMAVERYYQTQVVSKLDPDEKTLRAFWERAPERFYGMAHHEYYAVWYPSRAEAEPALEALRLGAPWDSLLAARFPPPPEQDLTPGFGTEADMFRDPVTLMPYSPDSTLRAWFAASRPGEVIGPRERNGQWWVYRYLGFRDGKRHTFESAEAFVREQWIAEESERQLREHLRVLRERYGVRLHEAAIAAVTPPDPSAAGHGAVPLGPGPGPARPGTHSEVGR